jgi:hypothetical protein
MINMIINITIFLGLSHQLSSASAHSLPSRIDRLSDCEDDYEEDDSSSALDPFEVRQQGELPVEANSIRGHHHQHDKTSSW